MSETQGTLVRAVVSADVTCFVLRGGRLHVLLVQRTEEPFAGWWALPGGVVEEHESLDDAARRVLVERTGVREAYLEQLYTFGDPGRDPRGRTVSVAYEALLAAEPPILRTGRGVQEVAWHSLDDLPPLAFDHARIVSYARWRLSQKLEYTPLAFHLLPQRFTLGDLRVLHEDVTRKRFDLSNFNRQALARWQLEAIPGALDRRTKRPARLYRYVGPRDVIGPPTEPTPETTPDTTPDTTADTGHDAGHRLR